MDLEDFRCIYQNRMFRIALIDINFKKIHLNGADTINFEDGKIIKPAGKRDDKGKMIYEGSILQFNRKEKDGSVTIMEECTVEYCPKYCEFITNSDKIFYHDEPLSDLLYDRRISDIKVIGNVNIKE